MRILCLLVFLALLPLSAFAQNTGNVFPTPNGQIAPGAAVLVPCGSIVNGQPVYCPPGPANGLAVNCTNCSPTAPTGLASNPVSGTIAVTNTFQTLIASNAARRACVFQNNGTHNMYFSIAPSPSLTNSLIVVPGAFYYCSGPANITITDTISITGTSGDAFAGEWQ